MSLENLPLTERLIPNEKCLAMAKAFQEKVRNLGSDSRIVQGENGFIDWEGVFSQSLLGLKLDPPAAINPNVFTDREKELYVCFQAGQEVRILAICDFDGVLVSPAHRWWGSGRIDLISGLGFREMVQAADSVIVRTSRWLLSDEFVEGNLILRKLIAPLEDHLTRFPFLDTASLRQLQKDIPDKIAVEHKPLFQKDHNFFKAMAALVGIPGLAGKVMVYSLISSEKDRAEATALLKECPLLAPGIVFFDTAHFCF